MILFSFLYHYLLESLQVDTRLVRVLYVVITLHTHISPHYDDINPICFHPSSKLLFSILIIFTYIFCILIDLIFY